jgi:hypothetical protein
MRCSVARALIAFAILALSVSVVSDVAAQDKTPTLTGSETSWIGIPPATDCLIDPINVQGIVDALRMTPSEEELASFPLMIANETDLPQGEAPDRDQLEVASAARWTAVACLNAGDYARFFACFSPLGINGFIQGILVAIGGTSGTLTEADLADMAASMTTTFAATPVPLATEDQVRIDKIRDARMLPDGRIIMLVDGTVGEEATVYAVFKLIDEQWLIDAIGQIGVMPT